MGLLDFLRGKKEKPPAHAAFFSTISGYSPVFSSFNGGVYEMLLTRAAINTIAMQFSKLSPEVTSSDEARKARIAALLRKPDGIATTSQFLRRMLTILECETTVFLLPIDGDEGVEGLFYAASPQVQAVYSGNRLYLDFTFAGGQRTTVEYDRVGVLREFQYKNDLYGEGNSPLLSTVETIHSHDEAIRKRITESADLRWMAAINNQIAPDDLKVKRDEFHEMNLTKAGNQSGLLLHDITFTNMQQIEYKGWTVEADQKKAIDNNVFDYFGVSESIIQNKFDEEEWNAFYEGRLEPLAIQASEVLTNMLFTADEIAQGDRVMFTANRLQYASNKTKIEVTQTAVDRGMMSLNDALVNVWNMSPVEGGDVRVIRGEYIDVEALPTHTVGAARSYLTKETGDDDKK